MVPYRPATIVPEGHRSHSGRGLCSTCYSAPSDHEPSEPVMWPGLPVGDIYTPTFHRYAPPPPWTEDALCAQVDPELFFPEKGASTTGAKSVCAACPIAAECLAYALDNGEEYGVWGGKSARERAA